MKKILLLTFILGFGLFTGYSVRAEQINDFSSQISINKDGTVNVEEKIVYDFGEMERHGIYRNIPFIKTNNQGKKLRLDLENISVSDENGEPYRYTKTINNQQLTIKIGDPNRTISGIHTYDIKYKVAGALTYFSDHDELYWNITGNDWIVPITSSTSVVELPTSGVGDQVETIQNEINSKCYTGLKRSTKQLCSFKKEGNIITFKTENSLMAGQGMTIVVGFPKGIISVLEPKPYLTYWETIWGKITALLITLAVLFWYIIYPIKIVYKWFKYGRDPSASSGQVPGQVRAWFDPPRLKADRPLGEKNNRFLTPGEVGTLGDETVDLKDISATIVDLARRGYFRIEERKKGDFYFVRRLVPRSPAERDEGGSLDEGGLLTFEQKLLSGLFGGDDEIRLKDKKLYKTVKEVKKSLYQETVNQGLFPKNPESIRTFYTVISALALFSGNLFLALVGFIFGRNMPRKTIEGVNAFNVAKSLKNFLTSQERQLEFQAKNQMMFEKLLPYAVVFGVEKIWAKRFEDIQMKPPDWYQSSNMTTFNSIYFANSLNSSFSSLKNSSAPPSTSSSGFSSGFSGGSSGGGGGGGGGGSW